MPNNTTKIVIAYDFDGTLAQGNIQENSFIPELGMSKEQFWGEVRQFAKDEDIDEILAYMYMIIKKADQKEVPITKDKLKAHGQNVRYFSGLEEYFGRINRLSEELGILIEHIIISSGTLEMIQETTIAKYFKHIFASKFIFNVNDIPVWPGLAINYTTKTQFLFRINKGIDNAWDNSRINEYVPETGRPVPFKNMIYIGDGLTDVPAMKMVKEQGGWAIGVFDPNGSTDDRDKVFKLLKDNRVNYVVPADYREDKDLDSLIRSILKQIFYRESVSHFGQNG